MDTPAPAPAPALESVEGTLRRARGAAPAFAAASRRDRAAALLATADALDAERDALVDLARHETHYGTAILEGELERTTQQLRFFGEVILDGAYLERATDGGAVDVHRVLVPLGIVAVFGSSNFPFAYGVAGGDTASALAAGCAVVVKEHPSHPRTCSAVLAILRAALVTARFDADVVTMVRGFDAGVELVTATDVRAVGFTGSTRGGRALHDLAASRPAPIPFYGELGSLNPVVVTALAAQERAGELGALLASSALQRAGQMCTKPGVILVAEGDAGDAIAQVMVDEFDSSAPVRLLNEAVREQFVAGTGALAALSGVVVRGGALSEGGGKSDPVRPVLFEVSAAEFGDVELDEVFGPTSLILRYSDVTEASAEAFARVLSSSVGRLVWNGPTTGLTVGWATHHGGGYPSSTSIHSSVGATAIRRWLRPLSYQGVPEALLPDDLRADERSTRTAARR
jgi:NADP-dependent aldehyde dehydrogenase